MHVARRWLIPAFLSASLFALAVGGAEAQFAITPDGTSSGTVNANTSGNTATFDVYPYAFNQYCWGTNGISCSVDSNGSGTVYVTFSTSSSTGSATVGLGGYSYDPPECDPQWMQCDLLWDSGYRTYMINQPPTAGFNFSPTTPNPNQSVSFTNTSTDDVGIVSYAWTFGDGGTSSSASPSHSYTSGGQKTVRLIVTDGGALADTIQQNVTVNSFPEAAFNWNPTTPNPHQSVPFTNNSTDDVGIVSYAWTFGDGGSSSSASPSHSYTSGGQKTVRLIVTDGGSLADTLQQNLTVNHPPSASFNWSPTQPDEGATVGFNGSASSDTSPGTISSYAWTFGDGQSGTGATPSHAYAAGGQYQVRLIVTDNGGAQDTLQQNITVNELSSVSLTVADANPGLELNRAECVTVAVGVAAVVCDDLGYAYGFTPLTILNSSRQLALTYNSSTAEHIGVVGVNVNIPSGQTKPDTVCVMVEIGSVGPEHCYDDSLYGQGSWTRFAVDANYGAPSGVAELLDYDVTVTSRYTSAADPDTLIAGRYVALHGQLIFGRGWWLGGYERLVPGTGSYGSHLIWIGGDQSYLVYKETATDTFVAQTRARPDTIIKVSSTEYQRRLIGGGTAHFNGSGIHQKTTDRLGYETAFTHSTIASQSRPTQVTFETPSAGTITGYELQYNGTTGRLEQVRVRNAAGTGWDTFTVSTTSSGSSYVIDSITAPDGKVMTFGHTSGIMTSITEPGGRKLDVVYDSDDRKVSTATISNPSVSGTPSVVYTFDAASAVGTDVTVSGAPHADSPTSRDSVSVRLNGPRTDVSDTGRVFTTAWGAVRGIRDALGATTWVQRTNQSYPALPTSVEYPNGLVVSTTYYSNGLLNQVTDGSTSAVTTYKWNEKWSQPDSVISPRGVLTRLQYDNTTGNLEWQAVADDTVKFTYLSDNLLYSVRDAVGNYRWYKNDSYGNLRVDSLPSSVGGWTRYQRDGRGYVVLTRSAMGAVGAAAEEVRDTVMYDVMGRITQTRRTNTEDAIWLRTLHTYDGTTAYKTRMEAWGGVTASDSTTTGAMEWVYDGLGRVILERRPMGRDSLIYDVAGNVVTRQLKSADPTTTTSMTYDALNRLTQRSVSSRAYGVGDVGGGVSAPHYSTPGMSIVGTTATIFGDTETFAYDVMGNLTQADNRYARIRRTYFLNGLLKADTLSLRNYSDSTVWSTHVYGLRHDYNQDGQDSVLYHPSALSGGSDQTTFAYSTSTGRMSSVTDALSSAYSFTYNKNGLPTQIAYPGGSRTMSYDAASRVTSLAAVSMTRDRAGLILEAGSAMGGAYDGFGHLVFSDISTSAGYLTQTFERNAFGAATYESTYGGGGPPAIPNTTWDNSFSSLGGLVSSKTSVWDFDEHPSEPDGWQADYIVRGRDQRGNVDGFTDVRFTWEPIGTIDPWDEVRKAETTEDNTWSYYDGAERLTVVQSSRKTTLHPQGQPDDPQDTWGTFEEYWYDALGRRVLRRIREESPICTHDTRCGADAYERYVWDGDQLLWEVQSTTADGSYTADIGYVHAGGIDQPLGMMRNDVSIILHPDWRGLYVGATNTSGTAQFTDVPWPSQSFGPNGEWVSPREDHTWVGSLPMGLTDQTGLQYRRNRYYDPSGGQFTQQDPIGFAGGINLYGYAGGDPINNRDPYGLCPVQNDDGICTEDDNPFLDCRNNPDLMQCAGHSTYSGNATPTLGMTGGGQGARPGAPDGPNVGGGGGGRERGGGGAGQGRSSAGQCLAGLFLANGTAASGITEHTNIRGSGATAQWRGRNGRWYSASWGGNQWTGGRNATVAAGRAARTAGKAFGYAAIGFSVGQGLYSAAQGDLGGAVGHSVDAAVGALGFLGPIGLGLSLAYFGGAFFANCG